MDVLFALVLIVEVAFALGVVALILMRLLPVGPTDEADPDGRSRDHPPGRDAARRDDAPT